MSTKPSIFKIVLFVSLLLISYLVFSRPSYSPTWIPHFDKIAHAGIFFILSLLTYYAFKPNHYLIITFLMAYASIIEIIQATLPYRTASFIDLIADFIGIFCFYLFYLLYLLDKRKKPYINGEKAEN
ncbi:VanZ family protein [uncultured Shewanella sp.]|uniref:VanZ family protein n=1 Tax=uncultured Shewanella sp. TaxID=173975 RepID=UPI00261945EE|nr:VanZ family protein [uncultured Shewanella sp.]